MMVSDLKLEWADLRKIEVSEITDSVARKFIEKIDNRPISFDAAAYVCSDARFSGIRDILSSLPDMRVQLFSSAGNVVHSPAKLPSIVIGHGSFENTAATIMAFDGNKSLPRGLDDFLNKETFIQDYARRNGTIYLVEVRNKDIKTVLMVEPRWQ